MLSMLRDGKIDLITTVGKSPEREAEFGFSAKPVINVSTVITVKAENTRYLPHDYSNWDGIRVGMIKSSLQSDAFARLAHEKRFSFKAVWFDDTQSLVKALNEGAAIDAALTSSLRSITSSECILEQFNAVPLYAAVRKNDRALLAKLDEAMENLDTLFPNLREELRLKYYLREKTGAISFATAERMFIEGLRTSKRELSVILNPDRKPLSWYENGEYRGIFKDIADEVSRRSGIAFRFIPVKTRKEFSQKTLCPDVDIVFDTIMDFQKAENAHMVLSDPYFSVSISILRDKTSGNKIRTMSVIDSSDIDLSREGVTDGVNVRVCQTMKSLLSEVSSNKSDAAYLYTHTAEYAVYEDESGRLVANYVPSMENKYCIGVRDDRNPLLFAVPNRTVLSLDDAFMQKIREKYTPKFKEVYSFGLFFRKYPSIAFGVPCAILLLICAFLALVISRGKHAYRMGVLFKKLPLRCFVLNSRGQILHYTLGQRSKLSRAPTLHTLDDILDEATRNIMREKTASVLKSGKPESVEFPFDGTYRAAIISKLPGFAFGSDTVIWISQDITELQKSRDETQKHEEFFRLTLNSIGDGVIATDACGNVLFLNPVAERLNGLSSESAKGKAHEEIFRIVNSAEGKRSASSLRMAIETGKTVEFESNGYLLAFDGKRYHISDSASPIRNRRGNIIGAILIFRDVTDEYRHKRELQESVKNWEAASDIAKLLPFRMHISTRRVFGDLNRLKNFWPIVEGKAIETRQWIIPEDFEHSMATYVEFCKKRQSSFVIEYRALSGGQIRYYRLYGRHDENNADMLVGLIQDITDAKEIELQKNAVQSLWKLVVDTMPIMLFVKSADDDFRYIQCNAKFSEFIGFKPEDVLNRTNAEIFARAEDAVSCRKSDIRIMKNGKSEEFNESSVNAKGELRHIRTIKMPFRTPDGKSILLGLSVDITEIEEQRRIIAATNESLERVHKQQLAQLAERTVINECLSTFMNGDYMQVPFNCILEIIRRHLGGSNCYVLKLDTESHKEICLAEAVSHDKNKIIEYEPPTPFKPSDSWYVELKQKHILSWSDMTSDSARAWFAGRWDKVIAKRDIRSLWLSSVSYNGEMWGTLGAVYDKSSQHRFSSVNESFLRSAVRIIELILMRIENRDNLVRTNTKLGEALKKAQSADRAKSFFIASVSHEIRTPLNAVIGFTELLRTGNISAENAKEYLDSISYSSNALLQLINDVLDLSKLEADQMKIESEPTNFAEVVGEVVKIFRYSARERNISLLVEIPQMPDLMLDKLRIKQILFNLVGNAVKFTHEGAVIIKAQYLPKGNFADFEFSVSDTGIGIAAEDQNKLMKPFVQLSHMRGTNSGNSGTGLGLSISKRMAEKMGGSLWLKSDMGKGSTFGVTLPDVSIAVRKSSPAIGASSENRADGKKFSVLVVDDVSMNLKVIKALCEKTYFSYVATATSGNEALKILEKERFDLILTDMWMPSMNGAELAAKIRQKKEFADIPIIAVTADVEANDNFHMELFSGVLLKPVTLEKIRKLADIMPARFKSDKP